MKSNVLRKLPKERKRKCVFKREHGLLWSDKANKQRQGDKQKSYMFRENTACRTSP